MSCKVKVPWLLSNLYKKGTREPLTPGVEKVILNVDNIKVNLEIKLIRSALWA